MVVRWNGNTNTNEWLLCIFQYRDFFPIRIRFYIQCFPGNNNTNHILFYLFLNIFYWLCYYSCPIFTICFPSTLHHHSYLHSPPLCSCPWVIHISSLISPFPILFLTSPCLFCTYHLCFLFPVLYPPFFPLPIPTGNPPCDLHFCDFLPVIVCFIFFVQLLKVASLLSFYYS